LVTIAVTAEQLAIQSSIRAWASRAGTPRTVRAMETDGAAWRRHWADVSDLGTFAIAVPEGLGGAGGDVVDLAAALEQLADALVPGPILPTALAALVLAGCTDLPAAKELVPVLATGRSTATVALSGGTIAGTRCTDGSLRLVGDVGPVLGADAASHLLLATGETWVLLPANHPGVQVTPREPVDFSRPLADIRLTGAVVSPDQVLPGTATARVGDLAATLYAVEAAGVAGWCVRTASEYARVRHQFGRPIGSFQAVKHLCAEMLCRSQRADAVAWDAARAADAPDEHPLAAAVAAAVALDAAVDNAKDCVQVLGGIGFTWEHDAHLYLRRAVALRQLAGGTAKWRRRAAELAMAGAQRRLAIDLGGADSAVRARAAEIAVLPEERRRAALAGAGYVAPQWPEPYGLAASPATQLVIDDELSRAGLARPDLGIGGWAVPAILGHGTPAQRERFAGPTLRGDITWCQLFSEPGAGSDLAGVRTRAARVAGGWRLSGQKVWTSLAREADWAICLARTDPDAPKHRGLTYFLVAMDSPGIDVRPLREITGEAMFNEVFLDDVFVPDECVVGAAGDGWRIARTTLATERVAMGRGPSLGEGMERLLDAVGPDPDPALFDQVGALVADGLAVSLLDLRAALRQLDGHDDGPPAAVRKLVGVRHRQAVAEAALTLCGPAGAVASPQVQEFLLTRCLSIAGGTTQILLSLVGERVLGLPRAEPSEAPRPPVGANQTRTEAG
jgi:alkylation response protein AidB-like acyl-CoA dehydrogenase